MNKQTLVNYSNMAGILLYDGPVTICMYTKNKE